MYFASNITKCEVSNVFVLHAFNHLILNAGCPQNLARNIWVDGFANNIHENVLEYSNNSMFKFGVG